MKLPKPEENCISTSSSETQGKKPLFIEFKDILMQYGIPPTTSNKRIYGSLRNSGLVATKQISNRLVLYKTQSIEAVFDFIRKQRCYKTGKYQRTAQDVVRYLDPTCPWTPMELGGLCGIGLLNYETIREPNTNSKHPRKYICEESYFRLLEFYEKQQDLFLLVVE